MTVSAGTLNVTGSLGGAGVITAPVTMQTNSGLVLNASGHPSISGNVDFNGAVIVTPATNLGPGTYTLLSYGGAMEARTNRQTDFHSPAGCVCKAAWCS